MAGPTLTAAEVVSRFNTIVRAGAANIGNAAWYFGNFPDVPTEPRLGSQAEITHTAADLAAAGQLSATVVYNIMHQWAMELTRVRTVRAIYGTKGAPLNTLLGASAVPKNANVSTGLAALNANLCLYFPIPTQPAIGSQINDADFNTFLGNLKTAVNNIRNAVGADRTFDIYSCHGNCHQNCHSSRSRR